MSSQDVSTTVVYMAYNTSTGAYVTGDVSNHTLKLVKDGTEASPTNSPSEVDSTNAPGAYKLTLTAAETQYGTVWCGGKSSTSNVIIIPVETSFEILPTALDGNGMVKADVEDIAGTTVSTSSAQLGVNAVNIGGHAAALDSNNYLKVDLVDVAGSALSTSSAQLGVNVVNWGGSSAGSLPTNFGSLSIDSNGNVSITSYIKANTALSGFTFVMTDSTNHNPDTGLTVTAQRSINGGTLGSCTNSVTEIADGLYYINLSAADLNGKVIMLRFTATGADDKDILLITQE